MLTTGELVSSVKTGREEVDGVEPDALTRR